jgi:hypothetical protein
VIHANFGIFREINQQVNEKWREGGGDGEIGVRGQGDDWDDAAVLDSVENSPVNTPLDSPVDEARSDIPVDAHVDIKIDIPVDTPVVSRIKESHVEEPRVVSYTRTQITPSIKSTQGSPVKDCLVDVSVPTWAQVAARAKPPRASSGWTPILRENLGENWGTIQKPHTKGSTSDISFSTSWDEEVNSKVSQSFSSDSGRSGDTGCVNNWVPDSGQSSKDW